MKHVTVLLFVILAGSAFAQTDLATIQRAANGVARYPQAYRGSEQDGRNGEK